MSNNIPVMIAGIGMYLPEKVVTNDDLATFLDTSDEWIYTRTGIKERRVVTGKENSVDLGVNAAKIALANANINPEEIDVIIVATSIPANLYPSSGCEIQSRIGAKNAFAFDVSAACSGFIYALSIASSYIRSGAYKNILIIATDSNSKFVDWKDRSSCVLFGDGAGAMVLKPSSDGVDDILSLSINSDGNLGHLITLPLSGENCPLVAPDEQKPLKIRMIGKEVYKFVVSTLPLYIEKCIEKAGLKASDIDYLIPHQANVRIIDAMKDRLGYEKEKVIINIEHCGNTSAASVPIAMYEGIKEGKIQLPSKAILCGFGAGMTLGACIVNLRKEIM